MAEAGREEVEKSALTTECVVYSWYVATPGMSHDSQRAAANMPSLGLRRRGPFIVP